MFLLEEPLGALAPFGPGMGVIDAARLHWFGDARVFLDAATLCALDPDSGIAAMLLETAFMWFSMLVAMAPPIPCAAADRRQNQQSQLREYLTSLTACWVFFVALQLLLQKTEILSPHLRVETLYSQITFAMLALLLFVLGNSTRSSKRCHDAGTCHHHGTCLPMFLLMFPLGLMNVVAMAGLMLVFHVFCYIKRDATLEAVLTLRKTA